MSGRLVILPKKSYCPWNSKNVERVLKDERLERERQAQVADETQREESKSRWKTLKHKNQNIGDESSIRESNEESLTKHFNLFEAEEQAQLHNAVTGHKNTNAKQNKSVGIMPVFLGESLTRERSQKAGQQEKQMDAHYLQKEQRRKFQMDPMKDFSSSCNSDGRAHGESHDATHNARDVAKKNNSDHSRDRAFRLAPRDISDLPENSKHNKKQRKRNRDTHDNYVDNDDDHDDDEESFGDNHKSRHRKSRRRKHQKRHRHESDDSSETSSSSSEDSRERRRRKKDKKHRKKKGERSLSSSRDEKSSNKIESLDIAELRKRRLEREELEKRREMVAIQQATKSVDSSSHYHDQYNPKFSRI